MYGKCGNPAQVPAFQKVAVTAGFKPATGNLVGTCSIQLSYVTTILGRVLQAPGPFSIVQFTVGCTPRH